MSESEPGDKMQHQVLCVNREHFLRAGFFHGFRSFSEEYLRTLLVKPRFVKREECEDDSTLKQIIPYLLLTCLDKVFTYVRGVKAGESRLHGKLSFGIGGHITHHEDWMPVIRELNELDSNRKVMLTPDVSEYIRKFYQGDDAATHCIRHAMLRELDEEVSGIEKGNIIFSRPVGFVSDDRSTLNQVHLGIVYHMELASIEGVQAADEGFSESCWVPLNEIDAEKQEMERWSEHCHNYLRFNSWLGVE